MVVRKCMVLNCPGNGTSLHKFPKDRKHDEKRIYKWLSAAGNTALLHLPERRLLERGICNLHFEAKYFFRRGLTRSAVPTLNLPDPIEITMDHVTSIESRAIDEPSMTENPIEIAMDHVTCIESRAIDEPSTSESTEGGQMHRRNLKRSREESKGKAVSTKKLAKKNIPSATFQ